MIRQVRRQSGPLLPERAALLGLWLLSLGYPAAADHRTWTLQDGSTVLAELQSLSRSGEVTLRLPDDEERRLPLSDLAPSDIEFIRTTGGRTTLPTLAVPQRDIRHFLGYPLGALRGEARVTTRRRLVFGSEIPGLTQEDWANDQIWIGELDHRRELWVARGNDQIGEADLTSLSFRRGRLAQVLVRIPVAPEESEKTALFDQLQNKLEQMYGLMDQIDLGDDVDEAWQAEVSNVHIGLMRRTVPTDVITISGTYLPLLSVVNLSD